MWFTGKAPVGHLYHKIKYLTRDNNSFGWIKGFLINKLSKVCKRYVITSGTVQLANCSQSDSTE